MPEIIPQNNSPDNQLTKQLNNSLKKIEKFSQKYKLNEILDGLPKESILFHNYVFENIDAETLFNESYLNDVFIKIVDWSIYGKPPEIKKENNIFIITYPNFKIYISEVKVDNNILVNKIIFDLNQDGKALYEKDLIIIENILLAFSLQGFQLNYIQDNLKIEKHKDLVKKILKNSENDKTKLIEDKTKLKEVVDSKKTNTKEIKKIFSFYLSNNLQIISSLKKQGNLFLQYQAKTEEGKKFHQIASLQHQENIAKIVSYIENTNGILEIIAFAKNYKELLEKINVAVKNNSIIVVKNNPSKFEKLWKKVKNGILSLKK